MVETHRKNSSRISNGSDRTSVPIETNMVKVLLPYFTGVEEIEALTIVDILRRAGVTVVVCVVCFPTGLFLRPSSI